MVAGPAAKLYTRFIALSPSSINPPVSYTHLILLSDIDGLYTADPRRDPKAELIPVVESLTPEILALAGGNGTSLGTGGMVTKLRAARIACEAGIDMVIANGVRPADIYRILDGEPVGTRFIGRKRI